MTLPVNFCEPSSIRAGDSARWLLSLPDYPATAGWVVTYTLVKSGAKITIVGAASGDDHEFNPLPATTATWPPGQYEYQARASDGTDAYTVRTGQIDIIQDFADLAAGGMDTRSHAKRTLDALEAWIEGRDVGVAEYEIGGRRMQYIPIAELLLMRDKYRRELRAGSGRSGRIYLRM